MTQPPGRPMVPEDLFRIRFVSDPQLHPDGRRVAFVVTMLSEARDEYLSTIWVVDVNGGDARPFTRGPRRDTAPRWSPDGRWLAFVSEREKKGKGQLHVMPADGGEAVRLTDLRPGVTSPAWSPGRPVARLRLAGRRVGGAGGRGGARALQAAPDHRRAQVQVERRGLRLRPAAAGLRGLRGRRAGPPAHRRDVRQSPSRVGAGRPAGGVRVRPPRGPRRGRRGRRLHGARRGRRGAPADADRGTGVVAGLLAGRPDGRLRRAHRRARGLPSPPPVRGSRRRGRAGVPDREPRPELRADDGRGGSPVARHRPGRSCSRSRTRATCPSTGSRRRAAALRGASSAGPAR